MSQTSRQPSQPHGSPSHGHGNIGLFGLVVGAIGVVFGDIGTSPLYTIREAFSPHYGLVANHDTVLGVLSMIFWSLTLVVTVKYVTIIMRADNDGEGGIMALMALAQRCFPKDSRTAYIVGILGILGGSLFFGDGVITPAISVLSAVEGLEVVAPQLHSWIVPITVMVLVALFATQRFGTARVGKVFGPVMVVWFIALAVLSGVSVDEFARLLQASDVAALTRIPGIGKKTAERMVVELRDRAAGMATGLPSGAATLLHDPLSEAITALQALGYKPADADRMARKAVADGDDAAIIIRKALQSALR